MCHLLVCTSHIPGESGSCMEREKRENPAMASSPASPFQPPLQGDLDPPLQALVVPWDGEESPAVPRTNEGFEVGGGGFGSSSLGSNEARWGRPQTATAAAPAQKSQAEPFSNTKTQDLARPSCLWGLDSFVYRTLYLHSHSPGYENAGKEFCKQLTIGQLGQLRF